MKLYQSIKTKYPDACLFFGVLDFYEIYGQDAIQASTILGLNLTKKRIGYELVETPMVSFPSYSLDIYLPLMVKAGVRVAVCNRL